MQRSLFLKASCFWRTAWCTWKISTFKSFDFIAIVKTTRRPVNVRSSHQRWSIKRVFLEILQNWHENNCANVPFFNKVAGLRPTTLLIKRLWQRCFPENLAKFLRTPFLTEHLWLLLLERLIYVRFRSGICGDQNLPRHSQDFCKRLRRGALQQ